ncbi:hypothetical protein BGZ63DRAFT_395349 [Mariannaea sp. PMI_226]|nr:hypothetical protein BGZ63DRAFT_395349 [Mariannaea sp. PMI_226]
MSQVTPEVAQAITQKMTRYTRYVDTKQWDKFEKEVALPNARFTYFTPDGKQLRVGKTTYDFATPEDLVKTLREVHEGKQILHMLGPGDFEALSDGKVKAVFCMEDKAIVPSLGNLVEIRGGGYYHVTWKEVNGEWFLEELRLERIFDRMTLLARIGVFVVNLLGL